MWGVLLLQGRAVDAGLCQGTGRGTSRAEQVTDALSQDKEDQNELCAAFEALGGQLAWRELNRLLSSTKYRTALSRHVALLLGGDAAAADKVVQESFAALQDARGQLPDSLQARTWLYRNIVQRARFVRRHGDAPRATPGSGLLALPERQLEAIVLCRYVGLSDRQAAEVMSISSGAVRSHLARAMLSLKP